MRIPPSFNFDLILDGGLYSWTNAGTSNFPTGCGAADLFALEVFAAPDGAGIIYQRVVDISTGLSFDRSSLDAGATWTTWAKLTPGVLATDTLRAVLRDVDGDIAVRDIAARDIAATGDITCDTIVPANIISTAGNYQFATDQVGWLSFDYVAYTIITARLYSQRSGTIRVSFRLAGDGVRSVYAQILKNGINEGPEFSRSSLVLAPFTHDCAVAAGDYFELKVKHFDGSASGKVSSFCLKCAELL